MDKTLRREEDTMWLGVSEAGKRNLIDAANKKKVQDKKSDA